MQRKPEWLRVHLSDTKKYNSVNEIIRDRKLNTVCEGANCPNRMDCYSQRTATFMILGNVCTRNCGFCNIEEGPVAQADKTEPERLALAVKDLRLSHAVITSVTRDDLEDGGAEIFALTVEAIRKHAPETTVELLIPDMQGNREAIDKIMITQPEVLNHNIETVPRLYEKVRPEGDYTRSLQLLEYVKGKYPDSLTKSGLMLGLGESIAEVKEVMRDLLEVGVDLITIGQYLQPSKDHFDLVEYISPEQFEVLGEYAKEIGFKGVVSGPLVRSSYDAGKLLSATNDRIDEAAAASGISTTKIKRLRVGVIMGGDSSERDVSLLSGKEFVKHLNPNKYHIVPIEINRPKEVLKWVDKIDFALLALHGRNGEDGKVQALLEALEIPYSGSGVASSAICIDKNMSKLILRSKGIKTPDWLMVRKDFELDKELFKGLSLPVIIKPNQGGSSIGIAIATTYEDISKGVIQALRYDSDVIIEEWIKGHEITCSMMNGEIIPVLSIQPNMTYYDYNAKYSKNDHVQKLAHLNADVTEQLKIIGTMCWKLFKLKAYARIDMIIQDKSIYVIEINTLPGMTKFSHLPKSANAMGMSYGEMLDMIIEQSTLH